MIYSLIMVLHRLIWDQQHFSGTIQIGLGLNRSGSYRIIRTRIVPGKIGKFMWFAPISRAKMKLSRITREAAHKQVWRHHLRKDQILRPKVLQLAQITKSNTLLNKGWISIFLKEHNTTLVQIIHTLSYQIYTAYPKTNRTKLDHTSDNIILKDV